MAGNQRSTMAQVRTMTAITQPMTTVTAIVTRELERSFTEEELAEAGGIAAAIASVVLECAKYGTMTDQTTDVKIA